MYFVPLSWDGKQGMQGVVQRGGGVGGSLAPFAPLGSKVWQV